MFKQTTHSVEYASTKWPKHVLGYAIAMSVANVFVTLLRPLINGCLATDVRGLRTVYLWRGDTQAIGFLTK